MNKEVISKKSLSVILTIFMASLLVFIIYENVRNHIDSRNLLGVWNFYADIEKMERIVVYDNNHAIVMDYEGDELNMLKREYVKVENSSKIPWPKYKREVEKHLKDLEFRVEIVFPENRNEGRENRKFFKDITTEVLSIYRIDVKDIEEKSFYNQYIISIDGQEYVVFLRDILLQIGNID
jgi:hypothetical protein